MQKVCIVGRILSQNQRMSGSRYAPKYGASGYGQRRYQDGRDFRDFDDRRDKPRDMDRIYDDKDRSRDPQNQPINGPQGPYNPRSYDIGRNSSSNYYESRAPNRSKSSYDAPADPQIARRSTDGQSKKEPPMSEAKRISNIIAKEYLINPPIQLNYPAVFDGMETWD